MVGFPELSVVVGFEGLFVGFHGYSVVVCIDDISVVVGFVGLSLVVGLTGGFVGTGYHSVVVDSVEVVVGVVSFSVGSFVDGASVWPEQVETLSA